MPAPSPTKTAPKLPAALRRAITTDATFCGGEPRAVSGKTLAALTTLVDSEFPPDIDRKRSLSLLARSDPSPATAGRLGKIAADASRPLAERLRAATLLAKVGGGEKDLLAALARAEAPLENAIVRSLGQVGGKRALSALRKARDGADAAPGRQHALAELAIALRVEPGRVTPEAWAKALDLEWEDSAVTRLDAKSVGAVVKLVEGPRWGIDLAADRGHRFACGSRDNVVLLNAALKPGSYVDLLNKHGMIAALVVAREKNERDYGVRWLLFTMPDSDSLRMALVRPNGETAFTGHATPDRRGLRFRLRDTALERAPAEAEGLIGPDDLALSIRISRGGMLPKKRPLPIHRSPAA